MLSNPGLMAKSRQQPLEHRLLLTATFCLLAGGAVMVYSASSARTLLEGQGDGTAYLVKYLAYGAVGLALMQLLARHGLEHVRRITPMLLMGSFVLLVLVLLPGFGVTVNGAKRWLGAGPLHVPARRADEARARAARRRGALRQAARSGPACAASPARSSCPAAARCC